MCAEHGQHVISGEDGERLVKKFSEFAEKGVDTPSGMCPLELLK